MSMEYTVLRLLMSRPLPVFELRRKLSPLRALDAIPRVSLPALLEDLEKRELIRLQTSVSRAGTQGVYELTDAGCDELASWMSEDRDPSGESAVMFDSSHERAGLEWVQQHLGELDDEIATWQSSVADRIAHSRLARLADERRLRALQQRSAFVRDAIDEPGSERLPRVLVAADSVAWRARSRHLLDSAGYEVQVAEHVGHAWELLQSRHFDALLLDAGDGMLDAFQLLDAARASDTLADLPIVISGVWDDPIERDAALAAGADAYVGNCDRETGRLLIEAIDRLVGREVTRER